MKAVVLCGGEGTRMRPLSYSQPKHLISIANRPVIERILAPLGGAGQRRLYDFSWRAASIRSLRRPKSPLIAGVGMLNGFVRQGIPQRGARLSNGRRLTAGEEQAFRNRPLVRWNHHEVEHTCQTARRVGQDKQSEPWNRQGAVAARLDLSGLLLPHINRRRRRSRRSPFV